MFNRLVLLGMLFVGASHAEAQTADGDSKQTQRLLLLGQKPDGHPATTHEYLPGLRILAGQLSKVSGLQTVVVQADGAWNDGPELLDGADGAVVFLAEGGRWVSETPARLAAFQRLASRGGGLSCLHWGMGSRVAGPVSEFTALFGACHGGPDRKYRVVSLTASPTANAHPIRNGIRPFMVHDEFYFALKLASVQGLQLTPLLEVPIDGQPQMVAWAADRPDGGRSFGFSGLHFHENWKLPEYRRLVLQGIQWTLKRDIPDTGLDVSLDPADLKLPDRTSPVPSAQ